jgi:anti-sigma B factor antagonist
MGKADQTQRHDYTVTQLNRGRTMAQAQGVIRFCQEGPTMHFKVEGQATMHQSLPFRRFVQQCLEAQAGNVAVDLRGCTYVDSTFLGTLLFCQRSMSRSGAGEFRLISPSPQCAELFRQMGVAQVFSIQAREEAAGPEWTVLTKEPEDARTLQRNVYQAHEELASLPGSAGEAFRAVVRCMAKDLEKNAPQ